MFLEHLLLQHCIQLRPVSPEEKYEVNYALNLCVCVKCLVLGHRAGIGIQANFIIVICFRVWVFFHLLCIVNVWADKMDRCV